MNSMKGNICENLLRRSVDNQFLAFRHNRREDEMLKEKFFIYQRQIRTVDHNIHMAERRFEHRAKQDLGLMISSKRKVFEPSKDYSFYYPSTTKNLTAKEYLVEPIRHVVEHQHLYESAFERHSRQYSEDLKRKTQSYLQRKKNFLDQTKGLLGDRSRVIKNGASLSSKAQWILNFDDSHRRRKRNFPQDI